MGQQPSTPKITAQDRAIFPVEAATRQTKTVSETFKHNH